MLINFFKIFFSIFLIIYQIPVYSKNNYINKFNYKDLSNYFSAQVSYDNQDTDFIIWMTQTFEIDLALNS